ncbi:hypothetical protein GNO47_25970 [Escherichia coli]|nr:hypothetical protein [Escherichia coli]EGB0936985.1 hypothetical protein [Escherichia coli]
MGFIKLVSIALFMISFTVFSKETPKYRDEYIKCLSANVDNPMSTTCIDSEVNAQNQLIILFVNKYKDVISPEDGNSIDLKLFAENQRKSIDEKCNLWLKAGGQNGVLLFKQCILDESISLKNMLEEFVNVIDG